MLTKHKVEHRVLHGDVTETHREDLKAEWNSDHRVRVLVGMIQMGIGLNLHAPNCVNDAGQPARCSTTVFYGLDWIATVPPTVRLAGQYFGASRAPMVFGWIFAGHQLGSATAAYMAGWTRSLWLTYTPAVYGAATTCLIATVLCLLLRRSGPASLAPPLARSA
jgi:hypothetical protein